ncbi:MAG: bifunctional 2-C-methyl-D-erythritol 4-phosphate cytidylyltransferase/2-C-methyl-D-erythritol 2,4-cyclodiphosphate synthase [Sphingopyxis sp.]
MLPHLPFIAIVVAGGQGVRAESSVPKQYLPLGSKAVLAWSVDAFLAHPACSKVIVVKPADDDRADAALAGRTVHWATGGATRQQSVAAGLKVAAELGAEDSVVMIHDAARPGIDNRVIDVLLAALLDREISGAVPVIAVADTLARGEATVRGALLGDVTPRDGLVRVQTPQAFRYAAIRAAHAHWTDDAASDDAQMVRANGGKVAMVEGSTRLHKLTTADDLTEMEHMIAGRGTVRIAVGMGYDVHRLVSGDGLWLGGVRIAHDKGLDGHSDADVLLHAITDALLGTIADGDIGAHFPPSDPQWRGASSDRFLAHAARLLAARGGSITHVDCTIICEQPKIGPHRIAMHTRIAAILGLPLSRISVKATTTERLGFAGRGEGIAAQAVVTAMLPVEGDQPWH